MTQVTGATLAAMLTDSTSSAADKIAALVMLGNMPLEELAPQENAIRNAAVKPGTDAEVNAAATATLAKLKDANEAKEAEKTLATEEAAELIKAGNENAQANEKEENLEKQKADEIAAQQVLTNSHTSSGPRHAFRHVTEPTFDAPPT